ncbi:IS1595 family transposase [Candidatus Trichorickettsia mobilis]|uniref:IS1595 family transposase n=1 Tax=Candidatus Trichorickettsia mobilis TaxID=1346319 RepID=UPI00292D5AC6|nr:IS1595 family transposase [Candidatus Trichorickettsia mobilis]
MDKIKKEKFTIKQFNEKYIDDNACLHQIFLNRYSYLENCPKCNDKFSYHKVTDRKCYACAYCGNQLHPLADTIFHKSSTSLKNWFYAIFLFSTSKNGVSAKELERQLGVTYKCAYRIAKQIRKLFDENVSMLTNIVEIDETYVGGKEINKHKHKKTPSNQGRSLKTKSAVLGAVERQGNIIAKVVNHTQSSIVKPFVRDNICITAEVKTDEYKVYNSLKFMGYSHDTVDHGKKEYVNGDTHTNNLEGFWSQLKRSINGTYHSVSPKYLQTYVNEFAYRYNRRNDITPLFKSMIKKVLMLV